MTPALNSQVHPQNQSPHLEVEGVGGNEHRIEAITLCESLFRHSCWGTRRRLVFESLRRTGCRLRRLEAFSNCGSQTTCEVTTDDVRVCGSSCRHALCDPCRRERAAKIRSSLHLLCFDKSIRFITLTLRHSPTPLKDQIDRLLHSFLLLRRRANWKAHVVGGAAFLEVKISEKDGLWHPHLHILAEGIWWDTKEISAHWHAITGDSTIVDITRPRVIEDVCAYAVGYCTKTVHPSVFLNPDSLDEAITALRGRRMCTTFGTWRGTPLEPEEPDTRVWTTLGRLETVIRRALDGVVACQRWVEAAARKYPALIAAAGVVHPTQSDEEYIP